MTAPAVLLLAPGEATPDVCIRLRQLRVLLAEIRPDLLTQVAAQTGGEPSPRAAVGSLARLGAHEIVIVPLRAARLSGPSKSEAELAALLQDRYNMRVSISLPLQATGSLFGLLDQRLHEALIKDQARELDSLILLHDSDGDRLDHEILERRARIWATRHKLPYRVAPHTSLDPSGIVDAVSGHLAQGHRHIGVANLSVVETADVSQVPKPLISAVSQPLGAHDTTLTELLTQYSVASLLALDEPAAS